MIQYSQVRSLSVEEYVDVLVRSTLAQRRPVDDLPAMTSMLAHADIIITARHEQLLIGIARAITDFSFCTYLADLAVDQAFQRQGIGQELIRRTHKAAGLNTNLILLSAPQATTFYEHIGLQQHHSCWVIPRSPD
jgi:GNAT superfamily N-acetyltransferase